MIDRQMYIQALYTTLRNEKRDKFKTDDYFWRLGINVMNELNSVHSLYARDLLFPLPDEIPTLYGIRVEMDIVNPDNIRLYEDITYTIGDHKGVEE